MGMEMNLPPALENKHTGMTLPFVLQAGGSTGLLMDLAANEKAVHADFFNGEYARFGCQA